MNRKEAEYLSWVSQQADINQCRDALVGFRDEYDEKSRRSRAIWITLAIVGAPFLLLDGYQGISAVLWIIAAFERAESHQSSQMTDLVAALWVVALTTNGSTLAPHAIGASPDK